MTLPRYNQPQISVAEQIRLLKSEGLVVYYIISILLYFLQAVNPQNTFAARFRSLLGKYPNVDVSAMGFPNDWQDEKLWQ